MRVFLIIFILFLALPLLISLQAFLVEDSPKKLEGSVHRVEDDLDNGVNMLAERLQASLPLLSSKPRPINTAILPINWEKGDQWEICRVVSGLLSDRISRIKDFALIESAASLRAISALKIDMQKGVLPVEKVLGLKKLLNCDVLITGYIADLYTLININLYLWDANNGNLISTISAQVRKTAAIVSLLMPPYEAQSSHHDYYSMKWKSAPLPCRILAMSINDIDGDKINELILATENDLKVLSWDGFSLVERVSIQYVDTMRLQRNQQDIRILSGLDADGDGCDEIYLSVPDRETTVWKLANNSIVKISDLPSTLLACQNGSLVFGSLKQNRNYFSGISAYQVLKTDNSKIERQIPVDFYSMAIAETNNTAGKEWLMVDTENSLRIYSENMEPVWQSPMTFGMGIAIADLNKNGINEIIGTSANSQDAQDFLIILEWEMSAYSKKWESQTMDGTISTICTGDPNNDGIEELIISVFEQGTSVIQFYSANYIY